jgi:hypothetical protein
VTNMDRLLGEIAAAPRSKYCASLVYSAWRKSVREKKSRLLVCLRCALHTD